MFRPMFNTADYLKQGGFFRESIFDDESGSGEPNGYGSAYQGHSSVNQVHSGATNNGEDVADYFNSLPSSNQGASNKPSMFTSYQNLNVGTSQQSTSAQVTANKGNQRPSYQQSQQQQRQPQRYQRPHQVIGTYNPTTTMTRTPLPSSNQGGSNKPSTFTSYQHLNVGTSQQSTSAQVTANKGNRRPSHQQSQKLGQSQRYLRPQQVIQTFNPTTTQRPRLSYNQGTSNKLSSSTSYQQTNIGMTQQSTSVPVSQTTGTRRPSYQQRQPQRYQRPQQVAPATTTTTTPQPSYNRGSSNKLMASTSYQQTNMGTTKNTFTTKGTQRPSFQQRQPQRYQRPQKVTPTPTTTTTTTPQPSYNRGSSNKVGTSTSYQQMSMGTTPLRTTTAPVTPPPQSQGTYKGDSRSRSTTRKPQPTAFVSNTDHEFGLKVAGSDDGYGTPLGDKVAGSDDGYGTPLGDPVSGQGVPSQAVPPQMQYGMRNQEPQSEAGYQKNPFTKKTKNVAAVPGGDSAADAEPEVMSYETFPPSPFANMSPEIPEMMAAMMTTTSTTPPPPPPTSAPTYKGPTSRPTTTTPRTTMSTTSAMMTPGPIYFKPMPPTTMEENQQSSSMKSPPSESSKSPSFATATGDSPDDDDQESIDGNISFFVIYRSKTKLTSMTLKSPDQRSRNS